MDHSLFQLVLVSHSKSPPPSLRRHKSIKVHIDEPFCRPEYVTNLTYPADKEEQIYPQHIPENALRLRRAARLQSRTLSRDCHNNGCEPEVRERICRNSGRVWGCEAVAENLTVPVEGGFLVRYQVFPLFLFSLCRSQRRFHRPL